MTLRVVHTRGAEDELEKILDWYRTHVGVDHARRILELIDEAIAGIAEFPLAWPAWITEPRFRVRTLKALPFRIFYEVAGEELRIFAIAHVRRLPGYWAKRSP